MKLWQRRAIGILTLGGGSVGFAAALSLILTRSNPIEWPFCIGFIAIYTCGIWCGVQLLEGKPGAERSAVKYWLIQIPAFGSPLFGYFLSSGFHTTVSLQVFPLKLNANFLLGSTFNYSLMQTGSPWFVGVNLFAIAITWWLVRKATQTGP
ncbi:hypothetical protein [Stenotrophomonas sp. MMGLT7]|uniref:hypothetical protein n=1 Tax=Stenotrophomonas sp. MMGLT7 TaxID=2901227 RepID=UPI001E2EE382|nr:hypothetical protein [Stenotrophomonas sp. MMGLT7]MCD7098076.1 hypothetical protein [Stenotrophomonas sp. MMGLT7]